MKVAPMGFTATIEHISGRIADGIWRKEDKLVVWFSFGRGENEHPGGTLGFGIELPAKDYSQEEFLGLVQREGEKRLKEIEEKDAQNRVKMRDEASRQEKLNSLAASVEAKLGIAKHS